MTEYEKGYEQGRLDENARIVGILVTLVDRDEKLINEIHRHITKPDMSRINSELDKALTELQKARENPDVSPEVINSIYEKIMYWNDLKRKNE